MKERSGPSASTSKPLEVKVTQLRLEGPVEVRLVSPPSRPSPLFSLRRIILMVIAALVGLGLLWAYYQFVLKTGTGEAVCDAEPDLQIILSFPSYLTTGETGELHITTVNTGMQAITTTLIVDFQGVPVRLVKGEGQIEIQKLLPGSRKSFSLQFSRETPPDWSLKGKSIRLYFLINGQNCRNKTSLEIRKAPLHNLRFLLQKGLSGLISVSSGLLIIFRKALFGESEGKE